jgi:hypothetical protein
VTIQDLGSIGELIAAVATVATLGYLAIQIRANAHGMKVESIRAANSDGMASSLLLADNAELADIFHRGLANLGSLTPVEADRFTMILSVIVNTSGVHYYNDSLGVDSTFLTRTVEHLRFLRAPGGRTWWAKNKRVCAPDFAAWVETKLDLGTESTAQSTAPSDSA